MGFWRCRNCGAELHGCRDAPGWTFGYYGTGVQWVLHECKPERLAGCAYVTDDAARDAEWRAGVERRLAKLENSPHRDPRSAISVVYVDDEAAANLTPDNIFKRVVELKCELDVAGAPEDERYLVVGKKFRSVLADADTAYSQKHNGPCRPRDFVGACVGFNIVASPPGSWLAKDIWASPSVSLRRKEKS